MEYCEKCQRCHDDGLRDDEDCPYYGEPCGCNHPNRGYVIGESTSVKEEMFSLENESALLKAALNPILACDERSSTWHIDCAEAVRKAQRIYNEGAVK